MRKVPHRLRHSTLGLQLVVLFREVLWPCWRNYIIAGGLCEVRASPHFHFALCFVFVAGDVVFQHPDPSTMPAALPTVMDSIPTPGTLSQTNSSISCILPQQQENN